MSSSNLVRLGYKKELNYGVTPAAVKAFLVEQDITYTAVNGGEEGNDISIEYLDTGTAGAEVVTVTGTLISVSMEDGVSTATQINAAIAGSAAAMALVTKAITGAGGNTQLASAATNLASGSGSFKTARFVSEQYSGTPETTESAQIRTDRQASGQVVTGLTVNGGHSFELAKEEAIEDFLESAMFNAWVSTAIVNGTFSLNLTTKKLIRAVGSFVDEGVQVGDFIQLSNFAVAANNKVVMATAVTALEVTFAHPTGMVTAAAEAASYQICDKLTIGTTKKSLTVEKTFLDLTDKALIYRGCLVSQMELNVEYGSLINGSFETQGNDYDNADLDSEFASYLEYFQDAATTNTMNGSVDMPFIATDVTGSWAQDAFCLQNVNISLNNNLTTQNCIGRVAPENYSPGTAQVGVELSSYLKDGNWDLLARKLSQAPFALGFMVENTDGFYGFYIPALQVSFDDPQSAGQNQEISIDMTGVAKVGASGESALAIYRAPS
jgi:hypothetical protein